MKKTHNFVSDIRTIKLENKKIMDLKELINNPNATIVDVREPWEFNMGHVEGSFNIPLVQVYSNIDQFKAMAKPLVLICASGNRSAQATALLSAQGIDNVYNGGSWQDVGYLKLRQVS